MAAAALIDSSGTLPAEVQEELLDAFEYLKGLPLKAKLCGDAIQTQAAHQGVTQLVAKPPCRAIFSQ